MEAEMNNVIERFQGEEPEVFAVESVSDFDSFAERLQEAEQDYQEACEAFWRENPGKESIMQAAAIVEKAAKVLYSRVQVIFLMAEAAEEDRAHAREILDMLTKDSCKREITCSRLYRKVREVHPEQKDRIQKLLAEKQKRMKFLDRCMATQAHYLKKSQENAAEDEHEKEVRRSYYAHRLRQRIPAGGRFCPPRIFPHEPIPEGKPVPWPPDVYLRFKQMEPEDLVFNMDHYNFELPPDYISEDGKMDSESIVWDYENHKVTMKYRGEEPVTWDFRQYIDLREVPKPEDRDVQYYLRLAAQYRAEQHKGLLSHRD